MSSFRVRRSTHCARVLPVPMVPTPPARTRAADTGGDDGADDGGAEPEAAPLVDVRTGRFITDDDAEGDGAFNRTATRAKGYGAAVQAMVTTDLAARDNVLVLGASADLADIAFVFNSEVGTLTPARTVAGSGSVCGDFSRGAR